MFMWVLCMLKLLLEERMKDTFLNFARDTIALLLCIAKWFPCLFWLSHKLPLVLYGFEPRTQKGLQYIVFSENSHLNSYLIKKKTFVKNLSPFQMWGLCLICLHCATAVSFICGQMSLSLSTISFWC